MWPVKKYTLCNYLSQFLADLRRSAGGDGQSPELDLSRSSGHDFGLPPRKRKVSQEVDIRWVHEFGCQIRKNTIFILEEITF